MARTRLSSMSLRVKVAEIPFPTRWSQQSFRFPMAYSQVHRQLTPMYRTVSTTPRTSSSPVRTALNLAAAWAGRSLSGAAGSGCASGSGYRFADQ